MTGKKMKSIISTVSLILCIVPLFADVSFSAPDINARNEVLFTVTADIPGAASYQTLFVKNIDSGKTDQLTFYPEAMESLLSGSVLQIRNRFGTGRYDSRSDAFSWIDDYKPFRSGGAVGFGVLNEVAPSPDGKWQVSIEPVSCARGRLIIYDTARSLRCIICESVERGPVPVSWSPDSSVLVYSIQGTLYFARPESFFSASSVDAQYRVLGSGPVSAVSWFSSSRLLYVNGKSVYRIQASELFARSLYSPLIGIGELAGKLPCDFDSAGDTFCASSDGNAIIYAKNGRNVYYCTLAGDDYASGGRPAQLPYLLLPGNTSRVIPVWTQDDTPIVFAESVQDGKKTFRAWKLGDLAAGKTFVPLDVPAGTSGISLSRTGTLLAINTPKALLVYSTSNWSEVASFRDEPVECAVWGEEPYLYVGGKETVRKWNYMNGSSSLLLLSSAIASGWDEQGSTVIADTSHAGRLGYAGNLKWLPSASARIRPAVSANAAWRVYADSSAGYFANMLYARAASGPGGTLALVCEPAIKLDSLASSAPRERAALANPDIFSHGSRTGLREIALVFDAMDTLDGLPEILRVLEQYKIRATFFINGEFIRQHPAAVNEIVKAGHQTASLFFTTWDLSGPRYRIDEDFIVRGLSRNEDDFYSATGQELTLLWHAPYYVTSPMILDAGRKAGYRYVSGDVSVLDWVTEEQNRVTPGLCKDSATIIEDIIAAKKPGSIIPVRIGKPEGRRPDYLYEKTGLLVNALVEAGYKIVTVDELIKNAR